MDERLEALFPFYALGAVSAEERAAVDAYVAANPEARSRLAEALRTASVVALDAPPITPAPHIKQTLMARVEADAQARFAPPQRSRFAKWRLLDSPLFRLGLPLVTAASVILIVLLGVWALSLNDEVARLRQQTALLQQQLDAQQQALAPLAAPAVRAMSIAGTTVQPQAHGQMLADPAQTQATLFVFDLKPLPPDRVYQFWLIRGDTPVSAGLFTVDDQGHAILSVNSAETVGSFDAIGVSIEPTGGSPQPTGDIVMLGQLAPTS